MNWFTPDIQLLTFAALSIGLLHTLIGPDHYLPFVALARARGWTRRRALWITAACGIGHCAGSLLLGSIGVALGMGLGRLEAFEALRGDVAAWLLLGLGLIIIVISLRRRARGQTHQHIHVHADGTAHTHPHRHDSAHRHPHTRQDGSLSWGLFVVFMFGPCEALIPLLMYPAAQENLAGLVCVSLTFAAATLLTMLAAVAIGLALAARMPLTRLHGWSGPIAGATVSACAGAMLLGL